MSSESKVPQGVSGANANGTNGTHLHQTNTGGAASDYTYKDGQMYQGSNSVARFITPGGNPIDNTQPAFPVFHRRFANPAPLGLLAFGATTFVLSMINVNTRGVNKNNIVLGMALFYGGLCQLLAGMWEFAAGNTFGATAFSSYGGFWLAYGCFYIPQFQVLATYTTKHELDSALGIFLSAWFIVTFIFFVASLRSSVALASLFFFLDITFLLLMCGHFANKLTLQKAGGGFGIFTAAIAGYIALAGMLTRDTSYFTLPVGELSRASTPKTQS
jgi:succinate-acetate transporter protein